MILQRNTRSLGDKQTGRDGHQKRSNHPIIPAQSESEAQSKHKNYHESFFNLQSYQSPIFQIKDSVFRSRQDLPSLCVKLVK